MWYEWSYSDKLYIVTSKKCSVVNTICINSFRYTHVITCENSIVKTVATDKSNCQNLSIYLYIYIYYTDVLYISIQSFTSRRFDCSLCVFHFCYNFAYIFLTNVFQYVWPPVANMKKVRVLGADRFCWVSREILTLLKVIHWSNCSVSQLTFPIEFPLYIEDIS